MNVTMLVLLIVAGVLLLAGFVVGLVFFVFFLVKSLTGATGGWRRLAEVYATANPATGHVTNRATITVGVVTYRRAATLVVADEGLYVAIWRKTALIPWGEFKGVRQAALSWQTVPVLTVGDPPVATMTVPPQTFELMRGKLPAGLAGA